MLPLAQQQAAGVLARQLSCITPHITRTHRSYMHIRHAQCYGTHTTADNLVSVAPSATAAVAPADEHGNLPHVSVLLQQVLDNLNHMPIKVYVDCTLGAGGHMAAMIQQHPELLVAAGIDVDPVAHGIAADRLKRLTQALSRTPTIHQLKGNYSEVVQLLSGCPPIPESSSSSGSLVGQVDAMLMDLGVSSMQFDSADRGFSFMYDGPIDMRMDPQAAVSAEELVNCAPEAELCRILRDYGEEKSWRAVARRIVTAREQQAIKTTKQLVDIIGHTQIRGSSSSSSKGSKGGRGIHPATRTFQALRIAVNDEIRKLEQALPSAISCLSPGGRLAVISFHSLEDRLVKHAFMTAAGRPTPAQEALIHGPDGAAFLDSIAAAATGQIVTRKPIIPSEAENAANPRSRSAKLRVLQRAGGPAAAAVGRGSKRSRRDQQQQQQQRQADDDR